MSDNTEEGINVVQSATQSDRNNMDDRGDGDNDAPPESYNCKDVLQSTDTILEEQPSSSTPSTAVNNIDGADVGDESFANETNDGHKTTTTEATTTENEDEEDDNGGVQQGGSAITLGVSGVDTVGSDSAPSTQPGAVWMFPRGSSPGEGDIIDAAVSDPLPILEATRVLDEEDQSPVVYNAVQVEHKPWYKQKRVYIALGSALIGAALAIGFTQGRDANNNNNELVTTDEESDTELVTVVPSSSPSQSLSPTSTLHFKPYGSAVNGKAGMDLLGGGISLSTDGSLQAVSAGQLAGGTGYVDAYMWDEEILDYKQIGKTLFGENPGDAFGYSLSASDNLTSESPYVIAIGAPFALEKTGMAKVYRYDEIDSVFVQIGDTLFGTNPGDTFGELVDISSDGSVLAIGSTGSDEGGENTGSVYVYKSDKTASKYSLQTSLNGEEVDDEFGFALSLSSDGNTLAVGSPKKESNTGQVKVFTWDEDTSDYLERETLSGDTDDEFGWSVSLNDDGSVLAVGSVQIDIDSPSDKDVPKAGLVKVYQWNGELSEYTQRGSTLKGDNNGDEFGSSIALSDNGETLIVGSPMNDKSDIIADYGQAKVFIWDASALDYVQLGESLYGENPTNYFGGPVTISGDGSTISIGAVGNSNNGPFSGQVTTFVVPTVDDSNSIN